MPSHVGDRDAAIHAHDCPVFRDFYMKHALGSKTCPSCLKCGKAEPDRDRWAIQHMELPDVYICADCCTPSAIGAICELTDPVKNRVYYKLLNETAGYLRMECIEKHFSGLLSARAPQLEQLAVLLKQVRAKDK
jgi:hypothetical protein